MILLDDEDQQLIRLILLKLVAMIERGKFPELVKAGFLGDFLNRIRDLKARDICHISLHKGLRIGVHVDVPSLVRAVASLDLTSAGNLPSAGGDDMLDYFILNHATVAMMKDLFRLSRSEVATRRRYLLGAEAAESLERGGRARLPRGAPRTELERAWLAMQCTSIPLTTCYRRLHEQFPHLSLGTIYSTVKTIQRERGKS